MPGTLPSRDDQTVTRAPITTPRPSPDRTIPPHPIHYLPSVILTVLSLTDAFDSLANLVSDSPWTYALILGLAALDVLFPVVPSETAVILAGVLAGTGHLSIELVLLSAAVGAFIGDNSGYWVGPHRRQQPRGPAAAHRRPQETGGQGPGAGRERGGYFIIVGRFVPGGRTVVVLACGLLKLRWARFMVFDAIAAVIWARRPAWPDTSAAAPSRTTLGWGCCGSRAGDAGGGLRRRLAASASVASAAELTA